MAVFDPLVFDPFVFDTEVDVNLSTIMDALAASPAVDLPATARYAWPQPTVVAPAWVIGYPDEIEFDLVFERGADSATYPCFYLVGNVDTKSARDAISAVISGAHEIKADIESDPLLNGGENAVAQSSRVTSCRPVTMLVGGVNLLAARFDVEVIA